ncbi:Sugar lactone lactonase YvrE [Aliiroseovarius halocynthiae]|uniref:SMP-30/gluconolactonase/LRE family protein n=1 Tax=Aliiroseovarius halocynthiae TaxID=985055 RepID=A0A545SU42_9RHOB|nr:SMP-30/gluconolactonase/LRE family protein [Aliiroseovarius halocynthiae]TQV68489.1 SMP-30/gluconolactonase/LRE family protein [Aliiroseovarius halocynthiae]SMR70886.1 Sugar lactone lactonase YvrE [Aliiroseovarius halocynthiae]
MTARVFSDTVCALGEGAFWHPERGQFFWFDILGKKLLTRTDDREVSWQFDECVSAAGWVDHDTLIMASASALWRFEITAGTRTKLFDLEADNPITRSNDGRADPQGGFWIGTMGYNAEPGAGAIYRFYRGELCRLYDQITITNAICFAPDGHTAYFTDTIDGRIMRQALDDHGWPKGAPEVFLDLSNEEFGADGAVVDADGTFWNAQWGAGRVAGYGADGALLQSFDVPTPQSSCPCFGGADLSTLFVTTAAVDRPDDTMAGKTFAIDTGLTGQAEHRVIL